MCTVFGVGLNYINFEYRKLGSINACYNMEINFFQKGHSKSTSNFSITDNLKKTACTSNGDWLVITTL